MSLYRRSFTQAIACSNEAGEWLYGREGFIILRNAINAKRFKFDEVKRLTMRSGFGFGDDEYVIGHIGKFMEAKIILFSLKCLPNIMLYSQSQNYC